MIDWAIKIEADWQMNKQDRRTETVYVPKKAPTKQMMW